MAKKIRTYHQVIERDKGDKDWSTAFGSYKLAEVKAEVEYLKNDCDWREYDMISFPDVPNMVYAVMRVLNGEANK